MGKQIQRSYELKKEIVEELLQGKSYAVVSKKYDVLPGTIANWKKKYLKGTLALDKRGKKAEEIDDIEIIKKSYALLKKIRTKQPK